MWVKRDCLIFELKKEVYIEFRVLLMTGFQDKDEAMDLQDAKLMFGLDLFLFGQKKGLLLSSLK